MAKWECSLRMVDMAVAQVTKGGFHHFLRREQEPVLDMISDSVICTALDDWTWAQTLHINHVLIEWKEGSLRKVLLEQLLTQRHSKEGHKSFWGWVYNCARSEPHREAGGDRNNRRFLALKCSLVELFDKQPYKEASLINICIDHRFNVSDADLVKFSVTHLGLGQDQHRDFLAVVVAWLIKADSVKFTEDFIFILLFVKGHVAVVKFEHNNLRFYIFIDLFQLFHHVFEAFFFFIYEANVEAFFGYLFAEFYSETRSCTSYNGPALATIIIVALNVNMWFILMLIQRSILPVFLEVFYYMLSVPLVSVVQLAFPPHAPDDMSDQKFSYVFQFK